MILRWVVGHPGLVIGLGVSFLLCGCSGSGTGRSGGAADDRLLDGLIELRGDRQLEILAEREAVDGVAVDRALVELLMGGQIEKLIAGTAKHTAAYEPTERVLVRWVDAGEIMVRDQVPLHPQIGKGYARARAAMADGAYADAAAVYERIAELSPRSASIFVGLGDAKMRAGDRAGALDAYNEAVNLGEDSTRVMVFASMGAVGEPERVIELCSRVWTDQTTVDRSGRVLAGVMLGRALLEHGSIAAGAEVLGEAIEMLNTDTARDPRYRRELVQLYTTRGEQMVAVGDAWMVLDQPERALFWYQNAAQKVAGSGSPLMARILAAHLLDGHAGMAGLELLGFIDESPGDDSFGMHRLVGLIGEHKIVGSMVLGALIDQLGDDEVPMSQRRIRLGLVLTIFGDDRDRVSDLVSKVDPSLLSPVSGARVLSLYEDWERLGAVVSMVERSPGTGTVMVPALVRLDGRGRVLFDGIKGESDGALLVRRLIALDLGRTDWLVDSSLEAPSEIGLLSDTGLIALARIAAMDARWDAADRLFDQCIVREEMMGSADRYFYADTLVSANRIHEAASLAQRVSVPGVDDTEDLMLGIRVALLIGDSERAVELLERSLSLDPYNEALYEQLITLRGPTGKHSDTDALRDVTRALGEHLPNSALVGLIRAHEIAGKAVGSDQTQSNGALLQQVERLLLGLHERNPWREIGLDLLLSVWATERSMGDAEAIERGLFWMDDRLSRMPGSVELLGGYARLLVLDDRAEEAEEFLGAIHERLASRRYERLEEGLVRSQEGRRDEADALALLRLDGQRSVESCIERLERAAAAGRIVEFDSEMYIPSGVGWKYQELQGLRVARSLGMVIETDGSTEASDLVLELVDRCMEQIDRGAGTGGVVADALDQVRIVALPTGTGFSMDDYENLIRASRESEPGSGGSQAVTIAMQALMRVGSSKALELLSRLSVDNAGSLDSLMVNNLGSLLGQTGTADDVESAVTRLWEAGVLVEARNSVVDTLGTLGEDALASAEDIESVRADLVYSIAVVASFYERGTVASEMYRLAIRYDPEHAWACNDLGYGLVEDGGDLVEAERLLQQAHQSEPEEASIMDSLGWARYALGTFDDERDGDGSIIRRGAKGLFEDAIGLDESNATIFNHLGDTLWMLGDFEGALGSWLDSEELLRARLMELSNQDDVNDLVIERIRDELSLVRFKIADGESGRVPKVAENEAGISVPVRAGTVEESGVGR